MSFTVWVVLGCAVWVICGALAWARTLGYFTTQYPGHRNVGIAAFTAVFGPAGLLTTFGGSHGPMLWRPLTRQQRWEAYKVQFPTVTYEDFMRHCEKHREILYSAAFPNGKRGAR